MSTNKRSPAPLAFKPDLEETNQRLEAFYAGDMLDRPVVCVTAPRPGCTRPTGRHYHGKVFDNIDEILDNALAVGAATFYGGESVPSFYPSFGPDELAVFTGAELRWSADSPDTNWSVPYVDNWEKALPLCLQADNPLWQRMLTLYRRGAARLAGKMLLGVLDLHSNMDLLAAIRGPERLCQDLLDTPRLVDRAMQDARAIFREWWAACAQAGRMEERGYCQTIYSMEGAAFLQCDFSCMISPTMFRHWVLPALEEEAEIVKHVVYHWDGPSALVHTNDLVHSRGLHTLSYVPGAGRGDPVDYIELYQRLQAAGKAVHVWGTPEQCKVMHRALRPEKTLYTTSTESKSEAEALLDWFVKNT